MAQSTATQAAANWKAGTAGAGQKWSQGIANCQVNPMQLAAAQADKAVANYSAAKDRMVSGLNATSVQTWKSQAAASQSNYTQGATKGLSKYTQAATKMASQVWPAMKQASAAAGGGVAGMTAAYEVMQTAKANGQTK